MAVSYEKKYTDLALACQGFYAEFDILLADNKDGKSMSFYSMDTHNTIKVHGGKGRNRFSNHADAFTWFRTNLKAIENEAYDA